MLGKTRLKLHFGEGELQEMALTNWIIGSIIQDQSLLF